MNYQQYAKIIQDTEVPDTLVFHQAIMWLHPQYLPVGLSSVGNTDSQIIKVPDKAENKYGNLVSVITISAQAFSGNTRITDIILPSSVDRIPAGSFAGCTNLKNITIPRQVGTIKEGTFAGCNNLENIYYEGTPEEWDKIEIVHEKHEIDFGPAIPGTPVCIILGERRVHIPGNDAVFSANLHFRCHP